MMDLNIESISLHKTKQWCFLLISVPKYTEKQMFLLNELMI